MGTLVSAMLKKNWIFFCLLQVIAVIIFIPILTNNFLADDYRVMNRVGVLGEVFVPGFFRPLSDFSLYFNYLLAGFEPFIYYITNVFFHACCSFMLYIFCRQSELINTSDIINRNFSLIAALLFLTYPFHNESIAWIVGRASLLATFFALASLIVATSNAGNSVKYFFVGLFYFIGLLAYESIFPLPAIILVLQWSSNKSLPIIFRWIGVFFAAIALHLVLRVYHSGVVTGDYGQEIFSLHLLRYVSNVFKITGRMLLPPNDNSLLLVISFMIFVGSYVVLRIVQRRKLQNQPGVLRNENRILLMLAVALIVPVTFSVSTRTSEGDRLLYFPSVFLCVLIAWLVTVRVSKAIVKTLGLCFLLIHNIIFLEINNFHWKTASKVADEVLSQMVTISGKSKEILLFNVPGEYKGAYILRNAFEEALLMRGIDTAGVRAVNYLNHAEFQALPEKVFPYHKDDSLFLGKSIVLSGRIITVSDFNKPQIKGRKIRLSGKEELWYWNKHKLMLLKR